MKTINVKVDNDFGNKVVLLKKKDNGNWHERGRRVSLKALYDGIKLGRYNVEEWTGCTGIMYKEYEEKKTNPLATVYPGYA